MLNNKTLEIELQRLRKRNLKTIIDQEFNGSVDDFAKSLEKNKVFIYGLLWDVEKRSSRNITDKTARFIEKNLRLPDFYLDRESLVEDSSVYFIPFIDISESEESNRLYFSPENSIAISKFELINKKLDPESLLAVRVTDDNMSKFFSNDDIILIDRSKTEFISNKVYFINVKRNFIFRRIARSITTGKIDLYSLRLSDDEKNYTPDISIENIEDIEIFGVPALKISQLKGI
ncbi:MAG: S24 family peptidase [Neisseriaceae bacterium]|nr:MAG: S24 family peptidase [Neisseriaceae bacterium]